MTNEARNIIAQYVSGNLTEGTSNNIPSITTTSSNNTLYTYLNNNLDSGSYPLNYEIVNTIGIEDYTILVGKYNYQGQDINAGFIVILDSSFKIVQLITQYSNGTRMSPFLQLEKDEKNFLYGVDLSNNKFRFVMLNNPVLKNESNEYSVILRQTYFLPDEYQNSSTETRNFTILRKNSSAAEYYLLGELTANQKTGPFFIHFIISVGTQNTWESYKIDMNAYSDSFYLTDCVVTYGFSESVNLVVLCGYSNNFIDRKYLQVSVVGEDISDSTSYDFPYTVRFDAKMISENEAYIAATPSKGQTGSDRFLGLLKIYHKVGNTYTLIYTYPGYCPVAPIKLFKYENDVYCFYQYGISNDSGNIDYVAPVFIDCFDNFAADKTFPLIPVSYSDLMFVQILKSNNIVQGCLQYNNTNLKAFFYKSKENVYNNVDCLYPDFFNIGLSLGTTNYSKDLTSISNNGNVCVCIGNVPNTEINDINFNYQSLYSKTNEQLSTQRFDLTKNIYENLYINFIYGYYFKNENTIESNMIDNSVKLMQATLNQGYSNFYISKIEVTYDDNTTEDFDLSTSIQNLYTARFTCKFVPSKNVKLIKMTNTDKSITFLEIPTTLIAGKKYNFTQDIEVI